MPRRADPPPKREACVEGGHPETNDAATNDAATNDAATNDAATNDDGVRKALEGWLAATPTSSAEDAAAQVVRRIRADDHRPRRAYGPRLWRWAVPVAAAALIVTCSLMVDAPFDPLPRRSSRSGPIASSSSALPSASPLIVAPQLTAGTATGTVIALPLESGSVLYLPIAQEMP